MKKTTIRFQVPRWAAYTEPLGRLNADTECQALWYYFTLAIAAWKQEKHTLVLEGEPDIDPKYERLFRNSALMYGAEIEKMANYWMLVDNEIGRQNSVIFMKNLEGGDYHPPITKLPQHLRFVNRPIEVKKPN